MQLRLLLITLFSALTFSGFAQSIGLIGDATPGGWDVDTNMVQDAMDPTLWTLDIALTTGSAKFRQDDDWAVNWGSADFPYGIGEQDGADIGISHAGMYHVTFNSATGAYSFAIESPVGIIGDATPGGWDNDTNMFPDSTGTIYTITIPLVAGGAKFRQDDDWVVNWGATDFPVGVGMQDGMNIPISNAGKYEVSLNTVTGDYSFTEIIDFVNIALTGTGTGGTDIELNKDGGNPDLWKGNVTLVDGDVHFQGNQDAALTWGSMDFPTGTATLGGAAVPVTAGNYIVEFNTKTGDYSFLVIPDYTSIGIIGDATPGLWDTETPLTQSATDPAMWSVRAIFTDGEAKFRANNDWPINWGAGDFPMGVGLLDGPNIPVPAGEYIVTFNTATGAYNFELLVIYQTIGLIGTATPIGDWATDVDMTKDLTDESFWYINSIILADGEAKFRADNDWAVNWGAPEFPMGVGTQGGPNILVVGGEYRVTLHAVTGDYSFENPLSNINILKSNAIKLAPNPARDWVNLEITEAELMGDVSLTIFNKAGQQVMVKHLNVQNQAQFDVSDLPTGAYTVQISNGKYLVGKSLVVVR